MRVRSYVTWFKKEDYIGTVVSFTSSSWTLVHKITEAESFHTKFDWESHGVPSEARAVFFGSKVSGDGPSDAVIKIHMQIPWINTINKDPSIRAQQACPARVSNARIEVDALGILTQKNCSSAPRLFDSKHTTQTQDQWIPGGYVYYILMERLPGIDPELPYQCEMDRAERDEDTPFHFSSPLYSHFECLACGIVHADEGARNLLWDKQHNKCYLLDWEDYYYAGDTDIWKDSHYLSWHLARRGESENFEDMSEWIL